MSFCLNKTPTFWKKTKSLILLNFSLIQYKVIYNFSPSFLNRLWWSWSSSKAYKYYILCDILPSPHISLVQQRNYYTPVGGWYNRVKFEFCKWHFHTPSHTIGESVETFKMSVCLNKTPTFWKKPKCNNVNNRSVIIPLLYKWDMGKRQNGKN